ncbi:FadR/GntR family transcriptional regulator [Fusibacillus kribbianus]|uniref:FadR/GntR family transcriptional regulator n=1 Tax=Fusibacillus kribbianus TaxID=3044208 RepID=A0AAP4EZW0_9FIRM|nr:FadR/GntR family transcriptional regulator [Ruminococcus sp. YH-rum2234]MDI9242350.1 FadR/GntR family transcriptional regulator [Ruminococcus sp. YH-rum2234]
MFREISKEKAFDDILDQIIENIQNGTLKEGDALPAERSMADALGVSRPVLREVLRALELIGVIKSVQGGANYIAEDLESCLIGPLSILFRMNNSNALHAQQLRSALEQEAALLAAQNCTPLDAAELQLIIAQLDAAEDEKIRGNLDRKLHIKIGKMTGNSMIFSVMSASAQLTEMIISGIRTYIMQKDNSVSEVDEQHRRLVEAIVNHLPEQAERCMREHMDTVEKYVREIADQKRSDK